MAPAPTTRPIWIVDGRMQPLAVVPATIVGILDPSRLHEIEEAWSPARQTLIAARKASGATVEHGHWDWNRKAPALQQGSIRVFALDCENATQGLLAVAERPRDSAMLRGSKVLYVDYIEAAPWNLAAEGHPPRYLGVGTALIAEAVCLSMDMVLGGRVGLHSLPQAERFYEQRCRMTPVGPDAGYYDLNYFEYAEATASTWLADMGFGYEPR